jgi:glutaminyl-tRNA synthetase
VQGTIHWVSARFALDTEVRLYDRLFTVPNPGRGEEDKTFLDYVNPDSLKVLTGCKIEPGLAGTLPGNRYQFERKGFFCVDLDSTPEHLIFNQTVPLRDTWAKIEGEKKSG